MYISNRTFIVSGGASGLGFATAQALHSRGGYLAILDLNEDAGEKAANELRVHAVHSDEKSNSTQQTQEPGKALNLLDQSTKYGEGRAVFFRCDVSETESIAEAVKAVVSWVNDTGRPIGGVIAAAGVGSPGKIIGRKNEPLPLSQIDFVLNINLRGTLDLIRQILPYIVVNEPLTPDNERGVLILVSSSAAFDGQPGQVAYAASKGAIASLTLPLARDLSRHGIRAVTIAPSLFDSNMTRLLPEKAKKSLERAMEFPIRAGQPYEFARLVLEGIENPMLNGCVLRLDGGMRMPSKM